MKKGIRISAINNVAKKAALGAMLAGSVAGYASNPVKTFAENPNHTEVVSDKGAEALKALAYPMLQQQKQSVPTTHNKALDEKLLKFANNSEEKKIINEYLDNIYKESGSYLGSAEIQQSIDFNMFMAFLDGNIDILKRFDEGAYNKIDRAAMQKVVEKSEPIKQWLNENYWNAYPPLGQFDHQPDYMEVNDALDDYIEKDPYKLFENGLNKYRYHTKNYIEFLKKSNMDNLQKKSNLIAAKTLTADEILFINLLKTNGLYNGYSDLSILENLIVYFKTVNPIKIQ